MEDIMGVFSWLDCNTGRQVKIGRKAYVLVPKEFGGGHITEMYYDGYGNFGGFDVYDLVADWNKGYITEANLRGMPKRSNYGKGESGDFYYELAVKRYNDTVKKITLWQAGASDDEMEEKYGSEWKRNIGIDIACYDEQNEALKFPIKICHNSKAVYEDCKPSMSDPNQGF